jgi:hypothetical protein
MDRWDILLIAAAGYIAISTLTRLMAARRNRLVNEVREQIADMQKKKRKTKKQDAA